MLEWFKIIGKIEQIEIIAVGNSIRILTFLNKQFGKGWKNIKRAHQTCGNPLVWSARHRKTQRKNKALAWLIMNTKFAVCINNKGFEASLEVGKLYEVVADAEAESDDMIRVVDEDGEDYLFEANIFYPLVIPNELAVVLHERV